MTIVANGKWPVAAVAAAVALVAATATGEAAWWNLGRKAQPAAEAAARQGPVTLAQSFEADRLNRIEAQMRTLTGQIEELTFQLLQMQEQLRRFQEDADYRLGALEGDPAPPPQPRQVGQAAPPTAAPAVAPTPDPIGTLATNQPEQPAPPLAGPGAPPQPLGTILLGDQPLDLSVLARGGNPAVTPPAPPGATTTLETLPAEPPQQVAATAPTGDPSTDFNRAYNLFNAGNYEVAEVSFRQFLDIYPGSTFAADAQYWLGESLFARARYRDAADAFREGYKDYPDSPRAPATLLRLGQALAGLAERDAACQIYAQALKQYPEMSNALRQRVVTEQASANC